MLSRRSSAFLLPLPFLHKLPLTADLERAVLQEYPHLFGWIELELSFAHIRQRAVGRGGVRLAVYRQTEGAYPVNVHGIPILLQIFFGFSERLFPFL